MIALTILVEEPRFLWMTFVAEKLDRKKKFLSVKILSNLLLNSSLDVMLYPPCSKINSFAAWELSNLGPNNTGRRAIAGSITLWTPDENPPPT